MPLSAAESHSEEAATAPDGELARQISQLDHLFRRAGDSPEIRQIYQLILDFHRNQRSA